METLRRAAELAAAGMALEETAAGVGVSRATLNNWQRAFSGMPVDAVRDVRESRQQAGKAQRTAKMAGSIHREPYSPRLSLADRRHQVLDAAARVIGEQGPHVVSIESVATQAGISRTVVKKVFATSQEILVASIEREITAARTQLAAVFDHTSMNHTTSTEAVTGAAQRFVAAVAAVPDRWRAILELTHSPTPAVRQWRARHGELFVKEIAAFIDAATPLVQRTDLGADVVARMVRTLLWEEARTAIDEPGRLPPDLAVELITATPRCALVPAGRRGVARRCVVRSLFPSRYSSRRAVGRPAYAGLHD